MSELDRLRLGRYKILEQIGRGAQSVVHRAEDPSLGRVVAVKAMKIPEGEKADDEQARFFQEAKAAGGLNHPNIITIYDTGREGDWAYIAMELLEGEELCDRMAQSRIPIPVVLRVAAQVAEALQFAHNAGVVHRDIKPANIMVMRDDHVKIMDFGIAHMHQSSVEILPDLVQGSPRYMSPEQVAGKPVDARTDIFSLGVVLFEMTAGIAPFSGSTVDDLMDAVMNARHTRASLLNPLTPASLDLVIDKALSKDPDARYQSAHDMAGDLAACRVGLRETADTSGYVEELSVRVSIDRICAEEGDATNPLRQSVGDVSTNTVPLPGNEHHVPPEAFWYLSAKYDSSRALERIMKPAIESQASAAARNRAAWMRNLPSAHSIMIGAIVVASMAGALAVALG